MSYYPSPAGAAGSTSAGSATVVLDYNNVVFTDPNTRSLEANESLVQESLKLMFTDILGSDVVEKRLFERKLMTRAEVDYFKSRGEYLDRDAEALDLGQEAVMAYDLVLFKRESDEVMFATRPLLFRPQVEARKVLEVPNEQTQNWVTIPFDRVYNLAQITKQPSSPSRVDNNWLTNFAFLYVALAHRVVREYELKVGLGLGQQEQHVQSPPKKKRKPTLPALPPTDSQSFHHNGHRGPPPPPPAVDLAQKG